MMSYRNVTTKVIWVLTNSKFMCDITIPHTQLLITQTNREIDTYNHIQHTTTKTHTTRNFDAKNISVVSKTNSIFDTH